MWMIVPIFLSKPLNFTFSTYTKICKLQILKLALKTFELFEQMLKHRILNILLEID